MLRRFEQFSSAISAIYHCIQKIERDEMIKYGLKGLYAQYLVAMSHCPDGMTAAQLGQICDKDKAAVSRAVTEMARRGLVSRDCPNNTLYRARLLLTPEGEQAARYVCQKARAAVEFAGKDLSDESRTLFYTALHQIASNLQTLSHSGVPDIQEETRRDP